MSRFLMVDIGAGTMDVLYRDDDARLTYKAVVKSPVPAVAEALRALPGDLLVDGVEMGGGSVAAALKERARQAAVVMTASAAATVHHDRRRVEAAGIRVIADAELPVVAARGTWRRLTLGDLDPDRLRRIVTGFGVPFEFDIVGVCAQDHGVAPAGVSHLDYRHRLFREALERRPTPHGLLHPAADVPRTMNRLRALADSACRLPAAEAYVMDSGMAAILGASRDVQARGRDPILVLDVATSHTVGAALEGGEIAGFFEYHTADLTCERLDRLMVDLAEGRLRHGQVLAEGGHGAYTRRAVGFDRVALILATGPRRSLLRTSRLPVVWGAPGGDNMMTGTVGLLEAVGRRKGLPPRDHL